MRARRILGTALMLPLLPILAAAQQPPAKQRWLVEEIALPLAHASHYEALAERIAGAAKKTNSQYRWLFYSSALRYTLVLPISDMSFFNDPEQFMKSFQGTAAEAEFMAAMQEAMAIPDVQVSTEVLEENPEWSCTPANPPAGVSPFVYVVEEWPMHEKSREYDAIIKETIAVLKEIAFPYQVTGFRTVIGDNSRVSFAVFYDTKENFFGPNNIYKLVEAKGLTARFMELDKRWRAVTNRYEEQHYDYMPKMSFWPI